MIIGYNDYIFYLTLVFEVSTRHLTMLHKNWSDVCKYSPGEDHLAELVSLLHAEFVIFYHQCSLCFLYKTNKNCERVKTTSAANTVQLCHYLEDGGSQACGTLPHKLGSFQMKYI